jgi:hypothetical protein
MHATYAAHLIILGLITVIIFDKDYRLLNVSLCSFPQPLVICPLLDQTICGTLLTNTINPCKRVQILLSCPFSVAYVIPKIRFNSDTLCHIS